MLTVITPDEVYDIIESAFSSWIPEELVPFESAFGRVLSRPVTSDEYVPGFDRSSVDGYAVRGTDTFGCSEAIPAILRIQGETAMGAAANEPLAPGCCMVTPTGGAVPPGADAVVMLEYTEVYGDGTVGICRPAAPGENLIFRGDDVSPGQAVLPAGRALTAADIGALAALGCVRVPVRRRPVVGVLSTGDELVPASQRPAQGQMRDVNSAMLCALAESAGAEARNFGIIRDDDARLGAAVDDALASCDLLLLSGGSSVGEKDAACRVLSERGELLFHGIAMKPGKPTLLSRAGEKPVLGLPGHPVAAYFVADLFLPALLARLTGRTLRRFTVPAVLAETVPANHGRAQYTGVHLSGADGALRARPICTKSGLITALAGSDGYFCIPRDCEGVPAGQTVQVRVCTIDSY